MGKNNNYEMFVYKSHMITFENNKFSLKHRLIKYTFDTFKEVKDFLKSKEV